MLAGVRCAEDASNRTYKSQKAYKTHLEKPLLDAPFAFLAEKVLLIFSESLEDKFCKAYMFFYISLNINTLSFT